ncbi:hypothetical protein BD309DRAFT_949407 [Dichomitus squalens]|nr:hypothetical protein BD309DRAFT_949407 [Dichomitus squalens]
MTTGVPMGHQSFYRNEDYDSQTSQTHRALRVLEVFMRVCEYADERTLARLARTCRHFCEPATQELWRVLPNLTPLVRCFPRDSWTIEGSSIRFTRALLPADWLTFYKYAWLVRRLGYTNASRALTLSTSDNVLQTLCAYRPMLVLLPNIRILSWFGLKLANRWLPPLLSLLGDKLTRVSLCILPVRNQTDGQIVLRDAFALLKAKGLPLTSLDVDLIHDRHNIHPTTSAALSTLATSLSHLVFFECSDIPLTPNAIEYLLDLGTLERLHVRLPESTLWPTPTVGAGRSSPICSLKIIMLFCTPSAYNSFTRAVRLPSLRRLVMFNDGVPRAEDFPEFLKSIRRQCDPAMLVDIAISTHDECSLAQASRSDAVIHSSDLHPLFDFEHLTAFHPDMQCRHDLDDQLFLDMAKAWPELKQLDVAISEYSAYDQMPSLKALTSLALHCSHLETLGVHFDAASWHSDSDWEPSDVPPERFFGELAHRSSGSRGGHHVALFLARAFPQLCELHTVFEPTFPDDDEDPRREVIRKRWEEVARYVPLFACIRQDERRRLEDEDDEDDGEGADDADSAIDEDEEEA